MKKAVKCKCNICGNYTIDVPGVGEICRVCFAENGFDDDNEIKDKRLNSYKDIGYVGGDPSWVRQPIGIELAGFYELENVDAQNDSQYIYTKKCLENKEKQYELAEESFYDENYSAVRWSKNYKGISKEESFKIFNALAYDDSIYGLYSAFNLALCYATGCGCKADISKSNEILKDISKYYDIYSNNKKITEH